MRTLPVSSDDRPAVMAITYELMKSVSARLYASALRKVPEDTKAALRTAVRHERGSTALATLEVMVESAEAAERRGHCVCSDAGVPVYVVRIGTSARFEGDVKRAITDGFAELVAMIQPPLLKHVTNPLTLERGYAGRHVPLVTFDVIDGADYVEIVCQPTALGSGQWAALQVFSFPSLETVEKYVLEVVLRAGSQHCPPVVIGVGIGGSFDFAAKLAKEATLQPVGRRNPEPILAAMEERLTRAVNATGFGPMGTGGDTTALAVHIDYAAGHGYVPVAVCFNCWINRRASARIQASGDVTWGE